MISFQCECGEPLAADDEHAGLTVRCPKCHAPVAVPEEAYGVEPDTPAPPPEPAKRASATAEGRHQARRMMDKAHTDLADDEAKRAREWRPVVFTPGIIGGFCVFVVCTLLAVGSLLLYNLYLAIGLLFFAVLGLIRCVLSFVGRGVD